MTTINTTQEIRYIQEDFKITANSLKFWEALTDKEKEERFKNKGGETMPVLQLSLPQDLYQKVMEKQGNETIQETIRRILRGAL